MQYLYICFIYKRIISGHHYVSVKWLQIDQGLSILSNYSLKDNVW